MNRKMIAQCALGAVCLAAPAAAVSQAQPAIESSSPQALLNEATSRVRASAYRVSSIDFPALEQRVRAAAVGARDDIDLLRPLYLLVSGLGDGHSFVNVPQEMAAAYKDRHGSAFNAGQVGHSPTSVFKWQNGESTDISALGTRKVLTLKIGMTMGSSKAQPYADAVYDRVVATRNQVCGYIVDLRGNGGGNEWPMVLGLSPLLGPTWKSHERDAAGHLGSYAAFDRGAVVITDGEDRGQTIVRLSHWVPVADLHLRPVAVLIDDATASSGEGVAVAFQGRPATRFFGQKTFGIASSNDGFMVGERINLVVTTALMADRLGRTYADGVSPDVETAQPATATAPFDPARQAARRWLSRQKNCRS